MSAQPVAAKPEPTSGAKVRAPDGQDGDELTYQKEQSPPPTEESGQGPVAPPAEQGEASEDRMEVSDD